MPDGGYAPQVRPGLAAPLGGYVGRALLLAALLAGATLSALATPAAETAQAVQAAGPELTRLLRAMAGLKLLFAAGLLAITHWRLALPAPAWRLLAYAAAAAAMAAGPVLIWNMAHLRLGALLLHTGLLATTLLLWRDPTVTTRLSEIVAKRRATLRNRA